MPNPNPQWYGVGYHCLALAFASAVSQVLKNFGIHQAREKMLAQTNQSIQGFSLHPFPSFSRLGSSFSLRISLGLDVLNNVTFILMDWCRLKEGPERS